MLCENIYSYIRIRNCFLVLHLVLIMIIITENYNFFFRLTLLDFYYCTTYRSLRLMPNTIYQPFKLRTYQKAKQNAPFQPTNYHSFQ